MSLRSYGIRLVGDHQFDHAQESLQDIPMLPQSFLLISFIIVVQEAVVPITRNKTMDSILVESSQSVATGRAGHLFPMRSTYKYNMSIGHLNLDGG